MTIEPGELRYGFAVNPSDEISKMEVYFLFAVGYLFTTMSYIR